MFFSGFRLPSCITSDPHLPPQSDISCPLEKDGTFLPTVFLPIVFMCLPAHQLLIKPHLLL